MAKGHTFHLQRYFLIFGALFSVAALGIIVYASQKPTNTTSHAAANCVEFPIFYTKNFLFNGPQKLANNLYSWKLTTYIYNSCQTPKKWIIDVDPPPYTDYYHESFNWRILPNGQANTPVAITLGGLEKRPLVIQFLGKGEEYNKNKFVALFITAKLASDRFNGTQIQIMPKEGVVYIVRK